MATKCMTQVLIYQMQIKIFLLAASVLDTYCIVSCLCVVKIWNWCNFIWIPLSYLHTSTHWEPFQMRTMVRQLLYMELNKIGYRGWFNLVNGVKGITLIQCMTVGKLGIGNEKIQRKCVWRDDKYFDCCCFVILCVLY